MDHVEVLDMSENFDKIERMITAKKDVMILRENYGF